VHLAKTIDELFGRNDSRANANKAAQCLRVIQPKTTQIKYVGKTKRIQHVRTHGRDKRYVSIFNTMSKYHVKTQNRISQEAVHETRYNKSFQIKQM